MKTDRDISEEVRIAVEEAVSKVRQIIAAQIGAQLGVIIQPTTPAKKVYEPIPEGAELTARGTVRKRWFYCPVPKCGKLGAGPIKDWFCEDHWKTYQNKPEERAKLKQAVRRRPQINPAPLK